MNKNSPQYEAQVFLNAFTTNRKINCEFYERVSEDDFDFRITERSDSVRESLAHQINVEKAYLAAIVTGELIFRKSYDESLKHADKEFLLFRLDSLDKELAQLLSDEATYTKQAKTPWAPEGMPVPEMLWGLNNHEILHTGWNLAVMDHLGIERFPSLKKMWG